MRGYVAVWKPNLPLNNLGIITTRAHPRNQNLSWMGSIHYCYFWIFTPLLVLCGRNARKLHQQTWRTAMLSWFPFYRVTFRCKICPILIASALCTSSRLFTQGLKNSFPHDSFHKKGWQCIPIAILFTS